MKTKITRILLWRKKSLPRICRVQVKYTLLFFYSCVKFVVLFFNARSVYSVSSSRELFHDHPLPQQRTGENMYLSVRFLKERGGPPGSPGLVQVLTSHMNFCLESTLQSMRPNVQGQRGGEVFGTGR